MKKILFNDKFNLTEAVLSGRKTQTRRIIKGKSLFPEDDIEDVTLFGDEAHIIANGGESLITVKLPYQIGEVVAVAQPYVRVASGTTDWLTEDWEPKPEFEAGWNNKLFVRADLMPHQIRITNVRVERINEISDEDCIREGLVYNECSPFDTYGVVVCTGMFCLGNTPREAYAALIDRISGRGTFESNPWVFAYDFELVKQPDLNIKKL